MPAPLRLFEEPEETPAGLDAIRAWLRKPRPRLRGVSLWIRWILSGIPVAYKYLAKNWPAARERIRKIASEGERVARGAARVGHAAREIGGGIVRSTRALRGPDGKVSGATAKVREAGRAIRGFGGRLTEGGGGIAAAFSSVGRLVGAKRQDRKVGLGLLDPPREPEPKPQVIEPPPPPLPKPEEPSLPAPPSRAERQPPEPRGTEPEEGSEPSAAGPKPETPSQPTTTPAADPERDARFDGLPKVFIRSAAAVGPRPHPEALRALILEICRHRDWTTPAQLARWFDMHRRSLANRYIRPLLEAGLLERRFPDSPNSPKQAYRTRREDPARSEAGTGRLSIPED